MRTTARVLLTLVLLLVLSSTVTAERLSEPITAYSADTTTRVSGRVITGKVYHARGMERREEEFMGARRIIITRMDLGVIWMLVPNERTYIEEPLQQAMEKSGDPVDLDYRLTPMGRELVNGVPAARNRMEATGTDGSVYEGFMWVSNDGILVKMDSRIRGRVGSEFSMELRNLRTGPQPGRLFEIPRGFRKFSERGAPGAPGFSAPNMPNTR